MFSNLIRIPPWSSTNFKSWLFKMLKLVKGRLRLNLSHRQLHAKIMLKIVKSTNMFKIGDFSQLYQLIQRVQLLDFLEMLQAFSPSKPTVYQRFICVMASFGPFFSYSEPIKVGSHSNFPPSVLINNLCVQVFCAGLIFL